MSEMTVPNGEKYGALQQKVGTIWTDLYTHENGEPVVTTWRGYFAVQQERDKSSQRHTRLLTLLVGILSLVVMTIETLHLLGK